MWSLLGIPVVLIGLLVRLNPLVVVTAAAVVAGLGGGLQPLAIVGALGEAFNDARYISLAFLILPLVGLLESAGMQSRARAMVATLSGLTAGPFLPATSSCARSARRWVCFPSAATPPWSGP